MAGANLSDSPYPTRGLVTSPSLLGLRQEQIDLIVSLVVGEAGRARRGVAVYGGPKTGKSSVLNEAARRLREDHDSIVVNPFFEPESDRWALFRSLIVSLVESLVSETDAEPWYRAWQARAYLRLDTPPGPDDLLASGLMLASNPNADLDNAILRRDVDLLSSLAADIGKFITVVVDEAQDLTENILLFEELVGLLDNAGIPIIIGGSETLVSHLLEAESNCLETLCPIRLIGLPGGGSIKKALSAPLDDGERKTLLPDPNDYQLFHDIYGLTGGNINEVMLVADALWTCSRDGREERFALSTPVLDRVLTNLTAARGRGDDLLTAARSIDALSDTQLAQAARLTPHSQLTVKELALVEHLRIGKGDDDRGLGKITVDEAKVDQQQQRLESELAELEALGVVEVNSSSDSFEVVGGRPTVVLVRQRSKARLDSSAIPKTTPGNFLTILGRAIGQEIAASVTKDLPGNPSLLGESVLISQTGLPGRHSIRPGIRKVGELGDTRRLAESSLEITPSGAESVGLGIELLRSDCPHVCALCLCLAYEASELEFTFLFSTSSATTEAQLTESLARAQDELGPLIKGLGFQIQGAECFSQQGPPAKRALSALQPMLPPIAYRNEFSRWASGEDTNALEVAIDIAQIATSVLSENPRSGTRGDWDPQGVSNDLGFLLSCDDSRLTEALEVLGHSANLSSEPAFTTLWNLANVSYRLRDIELAEEYLQAAVEIEDHSLAGATLLFFIPDREPRDSVVSDVSGSDLAILAVLQRLVARGGKAEEFSALLEPDLAGRTPGPAVATVLEWLGILLLEGLGTPSSDVGSATLDVPNR